MRHLLATLAALALLAGCGGEPEQAAPSRSATPSRERERHALTEPERDAVTECDRHTTPAVAGPGVPPALMRTKFRAGPIRRLRQVAVTDAYRRYDVTYGSGDLRISGVLLVPHGKGPFPAVVLNHGYIEPSIYVTGQGLAREQDRLARPASWCCTPTTAATRAPTRRSGRARDPARLHPRHDQRGAAR
jgi:hypothetical protein